MKFLFITFLIFSLLSSCISIHYDRAYLSPDSHTIQDKELLLNIHTKSMLYKKEFSFFKHHLIEKSPYQFTLQFKNFKANPTSKIKIKKLALIDAKNEIKFLKENFSIKLKKDSQVEDFSQSNQLSTPYLGSWTTPWIYTLQSDEKYLLQISYFDNENELKIVEVNYVINGQYLDETGSAIHHVMYF